MSEGQVLQDASPDHSGVVADRLVEVGNRAAVVAVLATVADSWVVVACKLSYSPNIHPVALSLSVGDSCQVTSA